MVYPKLSIITPSYNQGSFIEQTITSILDQNYPNLEYIVVDGGSTDKTVTILKKYSKRIKWISEKDNGQADAINKGVRMSTGDIIGYINSDDYYLPNAFERVAEIFIKNKNLQWMTGEYIVVNEKGKKIHSLIVGYKRMWRFFGNTTILSILNFLAQPSTFWRKEVVKKIGLFDTSLKYAFDYDFWLRLSKNFQLYKLTTPLSAFRIHSQAKGTKSYKKQFAEELQVVNRYTKNSVILFLHNLHNHLTVGVYNVIKS